MLLTNCQKTTDIFHLSLDIHNMEQQHSMPESTTKDTPPRRAESNDPISPAESISRPVLLPSRPARPTFFLLLQSLNLNTKYSSVACWAELCCCRLAGGSALELLLLLVVGVGRNYIAAGSLPARCWNCLCCFY